MMYVENFLCGLGAQWVLGKERPWPVLSSFFLPRDSGAWNTESPAGFTSELHPPRCVQAVSLPWASEAQSNFHLTSSVHTSGALPLGEELKIKPSLQILQVNTQLSKNSTFATSIGSQARAEG